VVTAILRPILFAEILFRAGRWCESPCAKSNLPQSKQTKQSDTECTFLEVQIPPFRTLHRNALHRKASSPFSYRSIIILLLLQYTQPPSPISRNGGSATSSKLGSFQRCLAPCKPVYNSDCTSSTSFCQYSCRYCYNVVRT
jgi:hypothetical protein